MKLTPEATSTGSEKYAATIEQEMHEIDMRVMVGLSNEQKHQIIELARKGFSEVEQGNEDIFAPMEIWDKTAAIVQNTLWADNQLTRSHQEALKYFSAGLLTELHYGAAEMGGEDRQAKLEGVYQTYFAMSPNIVSYVGGIEDQAEILAYAERYPEGRSLMGNMKGEIIYAGAFTSDTELFTQALDERSPVAQIELIHTIEGLIAQAEDQGWADPFIHKSVRALKSLRDSEDTVPFVRIVAGGVVERSSWEWVDLEELPLEEQQRLLLKNKLYREQEAVLQAQLHEEYPLMPPDAYLTIITNGVVGSIDGTGKPDRIMQKDGAATYLANPTTENGLKLEESTATLLRVVHGKRIKESVEAELGLSLQHLPLEVQCRLSQFMIEAKPERYAGLVEAIGKLDSGREAFAESFLATEFGDDFGDKLLSIAEKVPAQKAEKVFGLINRYRRLSREYANEYRPFDGDFAEATERAMNERLTDMITVAEAVGSEGHITVDTAPHRDKPDYVYDGRFDVTFGSIDEFIAVMEQFEEVMLRRRAILDDPHTHVSRVVANEERMGYQIYRFHNANLGDVLLHIRQEGAARFDKEFEYGNREGAEATSGWITNPQPPYFLSSNKDINGVSIRFDREGREPGEAPDSATRTPVRDGGMISLDVSSVLGGTNTPGVRIGRLIAAGTILRAREQGTEAALHHNTNHFDQGAYGNRKGFAELVKYTKAMAEARIATQRSRKSGRRAVLAAAA